MIYRIARRNNTKPGYMRRRKWVLLSRAYPTIGDACIDCLALIITGMRYEYQIVGCSNENQHPT